MKKILKYFTIFFVSITLAGCEGFVEGFEEDPNNPNEAAVDVNNMIQGVMLGDAMLHEGEMARLAGMWADYFTGVDRQYVNLNQYITNSGDYDSPWTTAYYATITQARLAQAKADKEFNPKVKGIAQILEAHGVGTTTALFGDIPFSEVTKTENPKFDPQPQIYTGLQALLDDAIKNLETGRGILQADKDIFFAGDVSKWIQVANTLKARYYLHVRNYPAAEAAALKGVSTPANDMQTTHGGTYLGNFNVYYSFNVYDRPGYMTAETAFAPRLIDPEQKGTFARNRNNAKTNETARFNWYYQKDAGTYDLNYYSMVDGWGAQGFFGAETSFPLVTYAETQLILAEARARQNMIPGALEALNNHRNALNTQFGAGSYQPYLVTDFAPVVGIENPNNLPVAEALLNEILEERYVTFIGQIEAFNDLRRTDNRLNIPVKGTEGKIPERFLYPQNEINANPNTPKPIPSLFEPTAVNK